jgi:hypothetical protein
MRRFIGIGLTFAVALVATGVALGVEGEGRSTKAVSASFTADLGDYAVKTCTGADGKYRRTHGEWEGEVTGDGGVAGDLLIRGTAFVHVPTGVGSFEGRVFIGGDDGFKGSLNGVIKGEKLDGLLVASREDKLQRLVANVSVNFKSGDFDGGKIGVSGGVDAGVLFKGSACAENRKSGSDSAKKDERKKEEPKKEEPKKEEQKYKEVHGEVTALSRASLTVKGDAEVTCEVSERQAADVVGSFKVGDKVVVVCSLDDGHYHLEKIRKQETSSGDKNAERKTKEGSGAVTAFGGGSISIALAEGGEAVSCLLREQMAAELEKAGVAVGTKVRFLCVSEAGSPYVLTKLGKL